MSSVRTARNSRSASTRVASLSSCEMSVVVLYVLVLSSSAEVNERALSVGLGGCGGSSLSEAQWAPRAASLSSVFIY